MNTLKNIKKGAWLAPFCFTAILTLPFYSPISEASDSRAVVSSTDSTMVLNYDGFFDRIEKLDAPEFVDVKLAFYLKKLNDGAICPIESVRLKTKLKDKTVYFLETGEIILPFDKQLDLDKAHVVIEKKTFEECGLDMRLESTKLFDKEVDADVLKRLTKTFDNALKEQAGMMSFLTPDVVGVTFLSKEGTELSMVNSKIGKCKKNRCTITINDVSNVKVLLFNEAPNKAIPFIER